MKGHKFVADSVNVNVHGNGTPKNADELAVAHELILFGGWSDDSPPKRVRGVLERLGQIDLTLRIITGGIIFIALKAAGLPTDSIFKTLAGFIHP